jgi:CheY-like chemotaxis protein
MSIKVLVVDDDPDELIVIKRLLRPAGSYAVDAVGSAEQALERLQAHAYDVVLCDYQLPGLNGVEFLRRLSADGNDTPVVLVTGYGSEGVVAEAMKAGAYEYVIKEEIFESGGLPQVIEATLVRHQQKKSASTDG